MGRKTLFGKWCPFVPSVSCVKEGCELYNPETQKCVFLFIANALTVLVEELKHMRGNKEA